MSLNNPSQIELNKLLNYFQNGELQEAEKLALSITQNFPDHPFGWKVLGVVSWQKGRKIESLNANKKAVLLDPQDTESLNNLGNVFKGLGRFEEAEECYRKSIVWKPDFADAHYNLGITLKELGRLNESEASYRKAIEFKPNFVDAHYNLGNTLVELGKLEEAETIYRQTIAIKSGHTGARHLLASLIGETTNCAPRDFVEKLFDGYAYKFDKALTANLEYKAPKTIFDLLIKKNTDTSLGSVLDLGCGTGLAGQEIKSYCSYLEGIDLSNSMLEKARKKNIYDKLMHIDILDYLSTEYLNFDYFVSTDVFTYIGDLSDVFRLIKSRNKSGGKLAFSTEHTEKESFFLEKTGRYSHSKAYIESLCEKFKYSLIHFEKSNLRKEKDNFISGGFYILDF